MSFKKRILLTLSLLILSLFVGCLLLFLPSTPEANWKEHTLPIDRSVKKDICEKFSLEAKSEICDPTKEIYAIEYVPYMAEYFRLGEEDVATYEEVDKLLNVYRYTECQKSGPILENEIFSTLVCRYDLVGDGEYRIIARFDIKTGRLLEFFMNLEQ